jgi:hypothetical protein
MAELDHTLPVTSATMRQNMGTLTECPHLESFLLRQIVDAQHARAGALEAV